MTSRPLISCVVPVFNGERYLAEALRSIAAQTYEPLEIIVADDGSTDATAAVATHQEHELVYVRQDNAGPAAARNLGVSAARGEFLAFLDADDLWHPDKLARQMTCFEADPDLAVCLTHVQNFWSPEVVARGDAIEDARLLAPWPGLTCNTVLAPRTTFADVGLFDPALIVGEDGDWFTRCARLGLRRVILPDVLAYRRLHDANLTRRLASASRDQLLRRAKSIVDRRRER